MGVISYKFIILALNLREKLLTMGMFPKPYLMVNPTTGKNEVTEIRIVQALLAELLGTMFLVLIGCGSVHSGVRGDLLRFERVKVDQNDYVQIALAFGVTVATLAQSIGHVSGCNINPAVTVGLITGGRLGLVKGLLYIVAQCIGATIGAALLLAFSPAGTTPLPELLGVTSLGAGVNVGQGVGIEIFITFVLVLCVFSPGTTPLYVGLSIATCHLYAIPLTGSSMNPARSFGPALVANAWANHWIYWVGPILGGIAAALTYVFGFSWERSVTVVSSENKPV